MSAKEEAILTEVPDPTNLLISRLDSWIHAVGIFEDYIETHITMQHNISSGLEKTRKAIADAPRFDFTDAPSSQQQSPVNSPIPSRTNTLSPAPTTTSAGEGSVGIAESFGTLRTMTDTLINKSVETEKSLKTAVLPELHTLKSEIEKHVKGLKSNGVKQSKDIEKAKATTLQTIELLGQHASSFSITSGGGHRHDWKYDPYVLYRKTLCAIDDQLTKENTQIDSIVFAEKSIETLERHIVQVIQQATHLFEQIQAAYLNTALSSYSGIAQAFSQIPPESEWSKFVSKNSNILMPYDRPHRNIANIQFNNDNHPSTKPILEGVLLRKEGKILKSYSSGHYVLTPSLYLLQYSSNNYVKDPEPEFAIFMPDTTIGALSIKEGKYKFTVQAKDGTKTVGLGTKTYTLKANSVSEINQWYEALSTAASGKIPQLSSAPQQQVEQPVPQQFEQPVPVEQEQRAVPPPPAQNINAPMTAEEKEIAHMNDTMSQTTLK